MESTVKLSRLLFSLVVFTPCIAIAAVGDIHTVKVDNAIVRDGPGKEANEIEKLNNGNEIMEMDVRGEWYEIYVADTDLSGWMHVSTLQLLGGGDAETVAAEAAATTAKDEPKAPAGKPVPQPSASTKIAIKSSGPMSAGVKDFEKYLLKYNARTNVLKGYVPFSGATDAGNGELQVTVTKNWLEKSKARQKSSLIAIYSQWKRANPARNHLIQYDSEGIDICSLVCFFPLYLFESLKAATAVEPIAGPA